MNVCSLSSVAFFEALIDLFLSSNPDMCLSDFLRFHEGKGSRDNFN